MPADPTLVGDARLAGTVRALIADVLMVPLDDVQPHTALVADLGAESVDFLDLVFRLEDALGKKIPVNRWQEFVRQRLRGSDLSRAITPEIVIEFARGEAG